MHEGLSLGVGLGVEACPGQEVEHGGDARGLEHDLVVARIQFDGIGRGPGLLGRRRSRPTAVQVAQGPAHLGAEAVRGAGPGQGVELGHGGATRLAESRRVGQARDHGVGGAEAGRPGAGPGVDEGPHHRGPLHRGGGPRGLVPVVDLRRLARGRQPGPVGVGRTQAGGGDGALCQSADALVAGVGARRGGQAALDHGREGDLGAVLGHVLVDERVGEAGQSVAARADLDYGLGPVADRGQDAVADLELALAHRAHPRTPTRTFRKRAGTAGWPVWPVCTGCPLPQWGVPQKRRSDSLPTRSMDAQNWGPMPV